MASLDDYVKIMRLKSGTGIVKGSSKATNLADKCAKILFATTFY